MVDMKRICCLLVLKDGLQNGAQDSQTTLLVQIDVYTVRLKYKYFLPLSWNHPVPILNSCG